MSWVTGLSTKNKILDAAEFLFAEHGFTDTSLRTITGEADVNLASVNYHFGSKKALIQAVFDRYFCMFHVELEHQLEAINEQNNSVREVLLALLSPLYIIEQKAPHKTQSFMKLLGRAYSEHQGHLRKFLEHKYGYLLSLFMKKLHLAYPDLPPHQLFWRLHFILGATIFTFAGSEALAEISEADFNQKVQVNNIIELLLPFLVAGFSSEFKN